MQCSLKQFALGMALSVSLNLLFASEAVSQTPEKDTTVTLGTIHFTPPEGWVVTKRDKNFYILLANGHYMTAFVDNPKSGPPAPYTIGGRAEWLSKTWENVKSASAKVGKDKLPGVWVAGNARLGGQPQETMITQHGGTIYQFFADQQNHNDFQKLLDSIHTGTEKKADDPKLELGNNSPAVAEPKLGTRARPTRPHLASPASPQWLPRLSNADYRIFLALIWREFQADETSPWNPSELPRELSTLDESAKLVELDRGFHEQFQAGRYAQAEVTAREIVAMAEHSFAEQPVTLAKALRNLAVALDLQADYDEAEKLYLRSLELFEKALGPNHSEVAACAYNLAALYLSQGRYAEAEPLFELALQIREQLPQPNPTDIARSLKGLAALYMAEARYPEAESCLQREIALLEKTLGGDHPEVLADLTNLARVYDGDGQVTQAEALYSRVSSTWDKASETVGASTIAGHFHDQALLFSRQGRYAEALALYRKALKLREDALGPDHPELAPLLTNLAVVLDARGDKAEAETLYRRSLEIQRKAFGNQHPSLATNLHNLAALHTDESRFDAAEPLIEEAIVLRERSAVPLGDLSGSYYLRATITWGLGRQDAAIADLRQAINLAEEDRARIPGSEYELAARFARFSVAFEQMVTWQSTLRHVEAAFDAAEQGRARTLQDQLELQGVDLLAGLPEAQSRELSRRQLETQRRLSAIQRQLRLAVNANGPDAKPLIVALDEARKQFLQAQRNCLSASPSYQLAISDEFQPVSLQKVQDWLAPRDALMLHYLLGTQHSYVFVIPPEGQSAQVLELSLEATEAEALSLPPGPLTAELFRLIMFSQAGDGLLAALNDPQRAMQATPQLSALWKVLIPAESQDILTGRETKRLFVVPDGTLGLLPFEALVVESDPEPQYLLDVGPAVAYGPSAAVLHNLSQRAAETVLDVAEPVLSVADPVYPDSETMQLASSFVQIPVEQAATSRYDFLGGRLTRLPYSDKESRWVDEVFKAKGIRVKQLVRQEATESLFRSQATHRRILHLACHGFADQKWGNLFGALALTPGDASSLDPADDGFLTLGEIYELDLRGCELAILSACQTNDGPQQRGEGVWSLSRGFLAAGARRTVASNWLVDDEAAASLISYFAGGLANAEQARPGSIDYANTLNAAKKWVRNQDKWSSPYYWAPFVLVGPN